MELKKLPEEVCSLLRSGASISTPSQCVAELVTNSLDAGATSIAVRVDFRTFKIQVIDNGHGINKNNLAVIGNRYMTSKCHSLTELQSKLDKFGFRGEALASLCKLSGLLSISSRAKKSSHTYSKVFAHGKGTSVGLTTEQRPCHGTTVLIQDFLYNMPVRRNRIKDTLDFDEIKTQLETLALVHPLVSFSLRNDASGRLMLQTRKCQNTVEAFRSLHGSKLANCLRPMQFSQGQVTIKGYIGNEAQQQKNFQYLYINNRLVVKTKLHQLILMILAKSFLLKAPGPWLKLPIPKDMTERFGMPMSKKSKHAIFIINLSLPYTDYDITLDPRKTLVHFRNETEVMRCMEETVKVFLRQENLTVPTISAEVEEVVSDDSNSDNELLEEVDSGGPLKRKHAPSPQLSIIRAVQGLPAKRQKTTIVEENAEDSLSGDEIEQLLALPSDSSQESFPQSSSSSKSSSKHKFETSNKDKKVTKQLPDSFSKLQIFSLASNNIKKSFAHHSSKILPKSNDTKKRGSYSLIDAMAREHFINQSKSVTDQACQTSETPLVTLRTRLVRSEGTSGLTPENLPCASYPDLQIVYDQTPRNCQPEILESKKQQDEVSSTISNTPVCNNCCDCQKSNVVAVQNHPDKDQQEAITEENVPHNQPTQYSQSYEKQNYTSYQEQDYSKLPKHNHATHSKQDYSTYSNQDYSKHPQQDNSTRSKQDYSALSKHNYSTRSNQDYSTRSKQDYSTRSEQDYSTRSKQDYSTRSEQDYSTRSEQDYSTHSGQGYERHSKQDYASHSNQDYSTRSRQDHATHSQQEYSSYQTQDFQEPNRNSVDNNIFETEHESPQESDSVDSLSEEGYTRLKAKLCGPLEALSKEINLRRHGMLGDVESPKSSEIHSSSVGTTLAPQSPNPPLSKLQSLQSFSYRQKPRYKPAHEQVKPATFVEPTSTLTNLNRHIYELENLAKQTDTTDFYEHRRSVAETSCEKQLLNLQRLSMLEKVYNDSHCVTQKTPTETRIRGDMNCEISDILSPPSASKQLSRVPNQVSIVPHPSPIQHKHVLSGAAVLQQLDLVVSETKRTVRYTEYPSIETQNSNQYRHETVTYQELNIPSYSDFQTRENEFSHLSMFESTSPTVVRNPHSVSPKIPYYNTFPIPQGYPLIESENRNVRKLVSYSSSSASDDVESVHNPIHSADNNQMLYDNQQINNAVTSTSFVSPFPNSEFNTTSPNFMDDAENSNSNLMYDDIPEVVIVPDRSNFPMGGSSVVPQISPTRLINTESRHPVLGTDGTDKLTDVHSVQEIQTDSQQQTKVDTPLNTKIIKPLETPSEEKTSEISPWEEKTDPSGRKYYINSKSGISSYEAPVLNQEHFSMTPRRAFLPKGMSPVMHIPSGVAKSQDKMLSVEEQEKLQQAVDENSKLDEQLATVKWANLPPENKKQISGFEALVQKLLNTAEEVGSCNEKVISDASKQPEAVIKVYNCLNQYKFTRDMLLHFKILGQWDSKFILTAVSMQSDRAPHLLVLFDQHAVHERVRLERLTREYQSNPETCHFRCEEISPPIIAELSEREISVMTSFHEVFERLGLNFEQLGETRVRITHVPTCLKLRGDRQRGSKGKGLEQLLMSVIREQVDSLLQTRGVGCNIPPTIQSVLNSEACTGAIKFGDPLTPRDCSMLLECLAQCQVPFQCAHGRPVLAPVTDLKHFNPQSKAKKFTLFGALERLKSQLENM